MLINLPSTISGSFHAPRTLSYPYNYYNIGGMLYPREGYNTLLAYTDLGGSTSSYTGKALFASQDGESLYAIFGGQLYRVAPTVSTQIGSTMSGASEYTQFNIAQGFGGAVISTSNSRHYYFDMVAETLTQLVVSEIVGFSTKCVYLDGRYIWVTEDAVYYSDVNDPTTVSPLSFFDAESRPDINMNIAVIQNDLYVFGSQSIERFRPNGSTTSPYSRVTNSIISVGYVAGLVRLSDRAIFIGRRVGGGLRIYELFNGSIREISNSAINEVLNVMAFDTPSSGYYGDEFDEQVVGDSFDAYGRQVVTLNYGYSKFTDGTIDGNGGGFTLYAIEDEGVYKWGFLSDEGNPEYNSSVDNYGALLFSEITNLNISNKFKFRFHTYFKGKWVAMGSYAIGHSSPLDATFRPYEGVYYKGVDGGNVVNSGRSTVQIEWANDDVENVYRGFRSYSRGDEDKPLSISRIEVAYAKNGINSNLAQDNITGGDASDQLMLSVTPDGTGWGYNNGGSVTKGKSWSDFISTPIGSKDNVGRVMFQPTGGIVKGDNYIGYSIVDSTDIPSLLEKVIFYD